MSWLSSLVDIGTSLIPGGGLIKTAVKAVVPAVTSIFSKKAAATVATVGAGAAAATLAPKLLGGGSTAMVPYAGAGNLPALPGLAAAGQTSAIASTSPGGLPVPWWKGPGGKFQLPWNDPKIPEYLKSFALDDAYLKVYYRAPRGYVVVKDANGKPYAVNRMVAKQFGLWRPAAKPPISATDWKHFKRNKLIERRIRKNFGSAMRPKHHTDVHHTKKR